jgi:hypothetical protein
MGLRIRRCDFRSCAGGFSGSLFTLCDRVGERAPDCWAPAVETSRPAEEKRTIPVATQRKERIIINGISDWSIVGALRIANLTEPRVQERSLSNLDAFKKMIGNF